jgi:predicted glycosyltransferase involved in capsule biosynthesis
MISVLIGHRGMERLPLLLLTLRSVAAQTGVNLECIVIEQDTKSLIKEYLPKWVTHLFLKTETSSKIYNRSAAFNHGGKKARGKILLLHDNDMLIPDTYCKDIATIVSRGYEAINIKRYIFYLTRSHSERIIRSLNEFPIEAPEYIVQNLEAGGSMAITKNAYFAIGGMDEEFVGWGGEDIEFWKRCSLLKRWIWGYQPILHLWHQSQPLKDKKDNPNIDRIILLDKMTLTDRINLLRQMNWGEKFHV